MPRRCCRCCSRTCRPRSCCSTRAPARTWRDSSPTQVRARARDRGLRPRPLPLVWKKTYRNQREEGRVQLVWPSVCSSSHSFSVWARARNAALGGLISNLSLVPAFLPWQWHNRKCDPSKTQRQVFAMKVAVSEWEFQTAVLFVAPASSPSVLWFANSQWDDCPLKISQWRFWLLGSDQLAFVWTAEKLKFTVCENCKRLILPFAPWSPADRHMQRIGRLLQASMFLNYMWQKMRVAGGPCRWDERSSRGDEDKNYLLSYFSHFTHRNRIVAVAAHRNISSRKSAELVCFYPPVRCAVSFYMCWILSALTLFSLTIE